MAKRFALAEDVEREIKRLEGSSHVQLAIAYEAVELQRREYMANLQRLEAQGFELAKAGVTMEVLENMGYS